jgi:hypothetical protein
MGLFGKKDPLEKTVERMLGDISNRASHGFKSFSLDVLINEVGDRRLDDGAAAIANRIQEAGHTVSDIEFISPAKATLTIETR